jgi:hypothetical protein
MAHLMGTGLISIRNKRTSICITVINTAVGLVAQ